MCQESSDLRKYADESVQKQKLIEDWKQEKETGFKDWKDASMEYAPQTKEDVKEDLPYQRTDEKEIWQQRNRRLRLHSEAKKVSKMNPKMIFSKYFVSESGLSPSKVLLNFSEIKYMLDHYPDKEGEVYKRSVQAFESSLRVLGYRCITKKNGTVELRRISDKEKKAELKHNRKIRENLEEEIVKHSYKLADDAFQRALNEQKEKSPKAQTNDRMTEIKNLLSSPEYQGKSEEEKKVIDRIYDEFVRLNAAYSNYDTENNALKEIIYRDWLFSSGTREEQEYVGRIQSICTNKRFDNENKMKLLDKRIDIFASGVRKTLSGEGYTAEEELALRDYIQIQGEQEEARRNAEEQANRYTRIYNRKSEIFKQEIAKSGLKWNENLINTGGTRFMMFMIVNDDKYNLNPKVVEALKIFLELGDNADKSKEMGRLMKNILLPLYDKIKYYDVKALDGLTDDELLQKAEESPEWADELQELGMLAQQLGDRGRVIDPDDALGRPIKEVLCGENDLFVYKFGVISEAALRLRSLSMLRAYRLGCLDRNSFTQNEYEFKLKSGGKTLAGNDDILLFIKKSLENTVNMKNSNAFLLHKYEERKANLERLKNFDTSKFYNCPDEVLLEHNEELQEIYKFIENENEYVEKYSLWEKLYKKDKGMWTLKRNMMSFYAKKARFLSLKKDAEEGRLTQESFTEAERKEIRKKNRLGNKSSIKEEHMKAYIRETLDKKNDEQNKIYQDFFVSFGKPSYLTQKSVSEEYESQKKFQDFMDEMINIKKEVEKPEKVKEDAERKKQYILYAEKLEEELANIQKETSELKKNNEGTEKIKKLEEQEQEIKKKISYVDIILGTWTSVKSYVLADQEQGDKWTAENFHRNIVSFQELPAFANMTSEKFFTMFQKLYAGYRKRGNATPEEIEEYRKENVQGLLMYKEYLKEYTEYWNQICHFRFPSLEYVREHFAELEDLVALSQLNSNMVLGSREILDLTKTEDQILFYDVLITSTISSDVRGIQFLDGNNFVEEMDRWKLRLEIVKDNREKLKKENEEKTEEEKLMEKQLDDKFRQLAMEATDILHRGNEMQGEAQKELYRDFIKRAKELEEYVAQNNESADVEIKAFSDYYSPKVLRMDQIRAWNHQVQKKKVILEARLKE